MTRRIATRAGLALALACFALAAAGVARAHSGAEIPLIPGVGLEANADNLCLSGYRPVEGQGLSCRVADELWKVKIRDGSTLLTHGPDRPPSIISALAAARDVTPRQPVCAANNVFAYGQLAIIAWPSDRAPDKTVASLRGDIATMNGRLHQAAVESGSLFGADYIFVCNSSGIVRVDLVQLDTPAASAGFNTIVSDLRDPARNSSGYSYSAYNRKYVVWYDAMVPGTPALGEGELGPDETGGPGNWSNGGPRYGVTYDSGVSTMMHELGHNLGAVQPNAPHDSGRGHCWEEDDVMCYDDGGNEIPATGLLTNCSDFEHFDCGHDDYFDAKIGAGQGGGAGSYLDRNWNIGECYVRWIVNYACSGKTPRDLVAPTVTSPTWSIRRAPPGTSTVPVQVSFTAADPSGHGQYSSGLAEFKFWMSTNGGSQVELALPITIGTTVGSWDSRTASITPLLAPGSSYRFFVAARDNAGNWGSAAGTAFTLGA